MTRTAIYWRPRGFALELTYADGSKDVEWLEFTEALSEQDDPAAPAEQPSQNTGEAYDLNDNRLAKSQPLWRVFDDTAAFEGLLAGASASASSLWEREFVRSLVERFDEYGDRMFVSTKQLVKLYEVAGRIDKEMPE